ncbi:MMS19 nucleotide excision repair protein homolog isoform X2 [Bos javanicus]|uniref:MMS19 nucleotide excision repair protein homolog isoform X2 n=1 Tax=Bos javanicus TaxID=9906 RepID=UPI0006D919CB|nr:PREDICTED: MMS19 nucleotide excision repair protein homolog isoform X2 [Bos mutus]XP_061258964.1 MMS19 nucleotide excision repair protein homolog isoform X2 [Bos javanicus]
MAAAAALEAVAPLGTLWGLVQDFVMGQQEGPADQVAADVKSGSYTVLQVVEALGSSLENPEPRTRARGIQLLSQVLLQCHSLLLEKEVVHLILFYENRLKDHHLVIPSVLQGLRALSLCVTLPPGLAVSVLKAIFQEVHVQSLPQVDRHTVYSIITNFMRAREEELKGLGADFTFGFIQVMDGEKDPRNLLVAFHIVYDLISRDYSLGPFVEELFEVTSCYFPIDFTPPPNDPHGIQREDLILSLRAVLASTPRFAEFLLPLLIEKVDSEILSAKLDSLQTLNACCAVYGQKELKDFLPSLWASIRREVFQTASERVEAEGLAALNSLTACLSRSVLRADAEDLLDSFLSNILQDCRHHLCEPDMKLVWPSAKLLQAAAGASARACDHVTSNVLPLLLEQFHKHSQSNQRRTILEMILGFLKLQQKWSYEDKDERPLSGFKDQLCSLMFMALTDPNTQLQLVGIRTLTVLGAQPDLLSSGDLELAVGHLYRLSFLEEDSQSWVAALEASGTLATLYPMAFSSHLVPRLAEDLCTEESDLARGDGPTRCSRHPRCLQALSAISTHPSIVKETLPLLLQHLCQMNRGSVSPGTSEVIAVCQSLQQVAENCQRDPESCWYFHQTAVPCLLALVVQASAPEKEHSVLKKVLLEDEVLATMASVIATATTHLSPDLASQSVAHIVPLFLDGNISFLPENSFSGRFQPFQDGSSGQRRLVALLMAFVCSLPRNVEIPQLNRLMGELLELSCCQSCPFSSTAAAKCFAGLLNKHPAGQQLDEFLQLAVDKVEAGLSSGPCRSQAFTLLLWVTKALVLRYHPLSSCLTERLMGLLSDPELGPAAADGFSLLMSDCTDVLTRAGHAEVRIMFRQRFFTDNVPALVRGFHAAPQDVKPNYLKGLSHVLNRLPKPVLLPELPTLLSLLLEALSCPDSVVQLSTLSCLQPLLLEAPQVMSLHVDTLITKFLNLSASPSMAVRIAALQCMHALTRLPTPVLLPYKPQVIRALAKPLDDKKRLVRKEAVSARGEWFLLGSPGS